MRLLLDTHVFLWAVADDSKLNRQARLLLSNASEVYVSAATIWEISIKARLGKIKADPQRMCWAIEESGFIELPICSRHAAGVRSLPLHHHDPFDRLLIAQAITEPLRLVTSDSIIEKYSNDLVIRI